MTAMVTGHRKLVPAGYTGSPWPRQSQEVQDHHIKLYRVMLNWCVEHVSEKSFISGMAIGVDQLFAQAAITARNAGGSIHVHAAIPFKGQESKWPDYSQKIYWDIINQCDGVTYVCEPGYSAWKMQKRNEWMVDHSNIILAVWDGAKKGGTYNCIQSGLKRKKEIHRLNPLTYEVTML